MNKAKWMQGGGAWLILGPIGYFLWSMNSIWNRFALVSGTSRTIDEFFFYWINSASESVVMYVPVFVLVMVGAAIFKKGKDLEEAEIKQEQALDEGDLDHGWRKNPFQKGQVSDKVLPRGNFLQKRNKFRKTIERPNSQGY